MSTLPDPLPMSQELHVKLDEIVALTGKPPERVLDEALTDYRERAAQSSRDEPAEGDSEESALEVAVRLGLLGIAHGGPPDLSTNPKYMEGFGLDGQ